MPTPTVPVTVYLASQDNVPHVGIMVRAKLDQNEVYDGFVISGDVSAVTDASGTCVLNLFPNAPAPAGLGTRSSMYNFRAQIPGSKSLDVRAQVPNMACTLDAIAINDSVAYDAASAGSAAASANAAAASAAAAATTAANIDPDTAAAADETYAGSEKVGAKQSGNFRSITLIKLLQWGISSAAAYVQSGVGAVARAVQDKLRAKVDPEDFGCVCDGIVDDTANLQKALTSGKPVRLVGGKKIVFSSRLIPPNGGGFIGDGTCTLYMKASGFNNTTWKNITAANCVGIDVSGGLVGPFTPSTNIKLKGFKLESEVSDGRYVVGICARNTKNLQIENIEAFGFPLAHVLKLDSVVGDSVLYKINVHDCTTNINWTPTVPQLTAISIDDDRVNSIPSDAIAIDKPRIEDVIFGSVARAAHGEQSDGINIQHSSSRRHRISNFYIRNTGEPIDTSGQDLVVTHGVIVDAYNYGLKQVHGASRNKFSHIHIIRPGLNGIVVADDTVVACESNEFSDITIEQVDPNNVWSASVRAAISLQHGTGNTFLCNNNVFRNIKVLGPVTNMQYVIDAQQGDGNQFLNVESEDGYATAYHRITSATNTVIKNHDLHVADDPRQQVRESDAPTDEKVWDTLYSGGDMQSRTRTDADGAGTVWQLIQRTGAVVDLIRWAATAMQFGGVAVGTRYSSFDANGLLSSRFDSNGIPNVYNSQNFGITAVGQGVARTTSFGIGNVNGNQAFTEKVLTAGDWATSPARSTLVQWWITQGNAITQVIEADATSFRFQVPIGLLNSGTGAFYGTQTYNGTLTANRALTWDLNDAARTISLSGNLTVSGAATVVGTNSGNETTTTIGTLINGATSKTTPVGADQIGLMDSAASNVLKKLSWTNLLAAVYASPSFTGTVTMAGALDISGASAGQIIFPATQNASAGANTLDDYEEGTFTPTLTFGGTNASMAFTTQLGEYTKKGNEVTCEINLTLSNKGSATGVNLISGLPFTSKASYNVACDVHMDTVTSGVGDTHLQGLVLASSATCRIDKLITGTSTTLPDTDFTATTKARLTLTYHV